MVENPDAVDMDATTSASVLAPGNAAKIADWIQQEVGGDLFSIVVTEPYSSDYDECLDRAADEKADNARPDDVTILDAIGVYRPDVDSSRSAIQEWIAGLDLDI